MSETKQGGSAQTTKSTLDNNSFFGAASFKPASEAPTQLYFEFYRGILELAARRLQAQAEYVKKLSEIEQPGDALAAHNAFTRETLASWFDEGRRLFNQTRAFVTPSK